MFLSFGFSRLFLVFPTISSRPRPAMGRQTAARRLWIGRGPSDTLCEKFSSIVPSTQFNIHALVFPIRETHLLSILSCGGKKPYTTGKA